MRRFLLAVFAVGLAATALAQVPAGTGVTPEQRAAAVAQIVASMKADPMFSGGGLQNALGLNAVQFDRFVRAFAEQTLLARETGKGDRESLARVIDGEFGAGTMQRFTRYGASQMTRSLDAEKVNALQAELLNADAPLSKAQMSQLQQAYASARSAGISQAMEAGGTAPPGQGARTVGDMVRSQERSLQMQQARLQAVEADARNFLDERQLAALKKSHQRDLQMASSMLESLRAQPQDRVLGSSGSNTVGTTTIRSDEQQAAYRAQAVESQIATARMAGGDIQAELGISEEQLRKLLESDIPVSSPAATTPAERAEASRLRAAQIDAEFGAGFAQRLLDFRRSFNGRRAVNGWQVALIAADQPMSREQQRQLVAVYTRVQSQASAVRPTAPAQSPPPGASVPRTMSGEDQARMMQMATQSEAQRNRAFEAGAADILMAGQIAVIERENRRKEEAMLRGAEALRRSPPQ